jgi:NAD(P)-dependent dehydrogenase (short-subunit alcohol dehydrogenase family)
MDLGLTDKIVLVTAASRGLGYAIAAEFLREGPEVVISARHQDTLDSAAAKLKEETGREPVAIAADCTNLDDITRLTGAVQERFGRIDVLINNSAGPPTKPFVQLTDDDWRGALEVKFLPQVRCARAVFPGMVERRWGRIITIIGTHGRQPHAYAFTAGVVNAALLNFSKALAEEGAQANVIANAINPGPIDTERMQYLAEEKAREEGITYDEARAIQTEETTLKRFGRPEEVASAVVFLASDKAGFITGTTLDIDGGQTKTI